MFLMLDGMIVGRNANPWKDKTFYKLVVSYGDGQIANLDCSKAAYDQSAALLLKPGSWLCGLSSRDFQGKTSLSVETITPAKPNTK